MSQFDTYSDTDTDSDMDVEVEHFDNDEFVETDFDEFLDELFDDEYEEHGDSPVSFSVYAIKETKELLDIKDSDYHNPNDYGDHAYYNLPGFITNIMEIKYELAKEFKNEKPCIRCSFYYKNMYRNVMHEIKFHPAHLSVLLEQEGEHAFEILGY